MIWKKKQPVAEAETERLRLLIEQQSMNHNNDTRYVRAIKEIKSSYKTNSHRTSSDELRILFANSRS